MCSIREEEYNRRNACFNILPKWPRPKSGTPPYNLQPKLSQHSCAIWVCPTLMTTEKQIHLPNPIHDFQQMYTSMCQEKPYISISRRFTEF